MAASNDSTLKSFIDAINGQQLQDLMDQFCLDSGSGANAVPTVGLTNRQGPMFVGRAAIQTLFGQLFKSFQNMVWTATALRLKEGNVIGIELDVTGRHDREWFQGDPFGSPPFSQIQQGNIDPHPGNRRTMNIPAFAVFTFDGSANCLVQNLALYFDRYKLMDQLAPIGFGTIDLPQGSHPHSADGPFRAAGGKRVTITLD